MGGSKSPKTGTSPYEASLSKMALDIYNQTSGIRNYFLGPPPGGDAGTINMPERDSVKVKKKWKLKRTFAPVGGAPVAGASAAASEPGGMFGDVIAGRFDPKSSPLWASTFNTGKEALESQYGLAKEAVLANLPRGGGQVRAITDVETARAGEAAGLPMELSANITGDLMNKAYGAAFGAPGQAMTGLGSAAGLRSQSDAIRAQRQAAQAQGMGSLIGMGIGYGLGGPKGGKAGAQAGRAAGGMAGGGI
ncbi:MAG: hypothetical protein QMD11_02675 [Smithella sp.]|nr:hypothetical protein [Smithella sp.]